MKLELLKGSRSRILAAVVFAIVAVFVGRLFFLQVIQHEYYVGLAREEQVNRLKVPASRGLIYSMSAGVPVPLVLNETVYTVFADPALITDKQKIIDVMRRVAGGNIREEFDKLLDRSDTRYQIIAYKVTRKQADLIKQEDLRGIGFQAVSQRVYPEGGLAGQILGFVNTEGAGSYGVEGYLDDQLHGTDGMLETVTDVSDVPLTIGNQNVDIPAKNGKNLVLSVDRAIQSKTEQALRDGLKKVNAPEGSVIVMNPNNGQVLAMANWPGFSPAEYYKVTNPADFNNSTVSSPYEPGSVMKTYTMAAGIDTGVVKPTDTYNNTDYITIDDRTVANAHKGELGNITFQTAMNWSLNTGFVTIAQRLGDGKEITLGAREKMYDYFHNRLKLGDTTGIELSGEVEGALVSPETSEGNAVRYSNMSFGQGMNSTMIQVASGFSAIANGGNYYQPTIIAGYMNDEGELEEKAPNLKQAGVIKDSTAAQVKEMIHVARTGGFPGVDKPGYYIGGKTGTAEVIVNGRYTDSQTIGSYLGFGGGDRAEYVIMVRVSGEGRYFGGATDALPIFTDISNWMLDYLKIKPKG